MRVTHRYELRAPLGTGGQSRVMLADDRLAHRAVALKLSTPTTPEIVVREWRHEFALLRELDGIGLPAAHDIGFDADHRLWYLALEFIDGPHLAHAVGENSAIALADKLALLRRLAATLAALHATGIVHGDLKPANILVPRTATGLAFARPVLIDFGLATSTATAAKPDEIGVSGTLAFLAPERFTAHPATTESDMYAFGAMAHWLLAGELPFGAIAKIADARAAHRTATVPLLPPETPAAEPIPDAWREAIRRCLSKTPLERPRDAANFLAQISTDDRTAPTPPPIPPSPLISGLVSDLPSTVTAISGPRGAGKNRLAHEFVRRFLTRDESNAPPGVRLLELDATATGANGRFPSLTDFRAFVATEIGRAPTVADLVDWLARVPTLVVLHGLTPAANADAKRLADDLATTARLMAPPHLKLVALIESPENLPGIDPQAVIELPPLAPDSLADMLAKTLRLESPFPPAWKSWLAAQRPMFPGAWRDTLSALADANAIRFAAGRWQIAAERDPATIEISMIAGRAAARIRACDVGELTALFVAAIGGPFATPRVIADALANAEIAGESEAAARAALDALLAVNLVAEVRAADDRWHIVLESRESCEPVVRLVTDFDSDGRWRRAILAALETEIAANADGGPLPSAVAIQLAQLADAVIADAIRRESRWRRAASAAEIAGDAGAALDAFDRAEALAPSESAANAAGDALGVRWRLTRNLRATPREHELPARLAALAPALQRAGTPMAQAFAECRHMQAVAASRACEWDVAEEFLREAVAILTDLPATNERQNLRADAFVDWAFIELGRADYATTRARLDAADAECATLADADIWRIRGRIASVRGHVHWAEGDHPAALAAYELAADFETKIGSERGIAVNLSNVALMRQTLGQTTAALATFDRAETLYRRLGMAVELSHLLNSRAHISMSRGDIFAARAALREALNLCHGRGDVQAEIVIAANLASEAVDAGDFGLAAREFAALRAHVAGIDEPFARAAVDDAAANLALADNDFATADAVLATSRRLFLDAQMAWMADRAAARQAVSRAASGDTLGARELLASVANADAGPIAGDAAMWVALAQLLISFGDGAWALAWLHAQKLVARLQMPDFAAEWRIAGPFVSRVALAMGEWAPAADCLARWRRIEGVEDSAFARTRHDLIAAELAALAGDMARARTVFRAASEHATGFAGLRAHAIAVAKLVGDEGFLAGVDAESTRASILDWWSWATVRVDVAMRESLAVQPAIPDFGGFAGACDLARGFSAAIESATSAAMDAEPAFAMAARLPAPHVAWRLAAMAHSKTGDERWQTRAKKWLDRVGSDLPDAAQGPFWAAFGPWVGIDVGDGIGKRPGDEFARAVGFLPTERGARDAASNAEIVAHLATERGDGIGDLATERHALAPEGPLAGLVTDDWLTGGLDEALVKFQRQVVADVLRQSDGNRAETARKLGIERSRLYRLLDRLGLS